MSGAAKWRRTDFLAALLLIFAMMWALNACTPLMMDDYDYSFSWATGEPLAGFGDVIASQAAHYMGWGGRSIVHAIAQTFLMLGKGAFNIANAAAYVLLIAEMLMLSGRRGGETISAGAALLCHALLMALTPFFGTVFLWLDGACNYLWGTALGLMPLAIAKSAKEGGFFAKGGAWRAAIAAALCFIAGWTNENTACGVFAVMLLMTAIERLRGGRIAPWRIACLIAQAVGIAVMLLAPGNFVRASGEAQRGFIAEMAYRFAVITYCGVRYCGIPIAGAFLLAWLGKKKGAAMRLSWAAALLGAAVLSGYAMIASPVISDRSFTGCLALSICAALALLFDGAQTVLKKPKAQARGALILAGICMAVFAYAFWRADTHGAAWQAQLDRAAAAKAAGEASVTLESVPSHSRFTMDIALAEDAAQWPNSTLSRALGIAVYGE